MGKFATHHPVCWGDLKPLSSGRMEKLETFFPWCVNLKMLFTLLKGEILIQLFPWGLFSFVGGDGKVLKQLFAWKQEGWGRQSLSTIFPPKVTNLAEQFLWFVGQGDRNDFLLHATGEASTQTFSTLMQ